MPACTAKAQISPAVMKLSCPANSPGAYADARARCSARSNGARSSCLMTLLRSAPSAPDRAATGRRRPEAAPRASGITSVVHVATTTEARRVRQAGPAIGLIAQLLLLGVLAGTA